MELFNMHDLCGKLKKQSNICTQTDRDRQRQTDRDRTPINWVDTGVQADKSSLEVRKGVRPLSRSLRQCLWLVADLERVVTR